MATSPEQTLAALRTLLEGPAASLPAGAVPITDNTSNLNIYIILCNSLGITFTTVAIVLRMYTKVFILRMLAWEDCEFSFSSYDVAAVYLLSSLRCHRPCMGEVAYGIRKLFY